jgi:hypothetical protein
MHDADQPSRPRGPTKKATPNNYFHIRVYTDAGAKFEIYRDKKQPSTRAEIIAGLRRAIELIERLDVH